MWKKYGRLNLTATLGGEGEGSMSDLQFVTFLLIEGVAAIIGIAGFIWAWTLH
jgi:hypothetical protein